MGYIKIDRKILDNSLWADKPFAEGQAWIDLLLLADYETKSKRWRGNLTVFERGTVNVSMQVLADRWGWSRDKTRHFIKKLTEAERVFVETHNKKRTVIKILNYDLYQTSVSNKPKQTKKDDINWNEV